MTRRHSAPATLVPACLWRYLITWALAYGFFFAVVVVRACILGLPARYFSALLSFTVPVVLLAYWIDEWIVRYRTTHGREDPADWCEPLTRKILLGVITVVGLLLSAGLLMVILSVAGVWSFSGGMIARDNGEQGRGQGGEPPPVAAGAFAPSDRRPAHLHGEPPAATALPGLLAYWNFEEGAGERVADRSGHGRDGTLHSVKRCRGIRGQAVWFDSTESWFDYGNDPAFNFPANGPFTITGWLQTTAAVGVIVSQRNTRDGGPDIEIALNNGRLSALVREDGGEWGQHAGVTADAVNDGAWHHFALTRNAGNRITLFVDGKRQGEASATHSGGAITTDLRSVAREQYWLRVRATGFPHWNGCIDEFAIFGRELSADEIGTLAGR